MLAVYQVQPVSETTPVNHNTKQLQKDMCTCVREFFGSHVWTSTYYDSVDKKPKTSTYFSNCVNGERQTNWLCMLAQKIWRSQWLFFRLKKLITQYMQVLQFSCTHIYVVKTSLFNDQTHITTSHDQSCLNNWVRKKKLWQCSYNAYLRPQLN